MKKLFLLIALFFSTVLVAQDDNELPAAINDIFNKKYPRATGISWYEVDGSFKVEFESHSLICLATFTKSGEWIEIIKQVDKMEMPKIISNAVKVEFPKMLFNTGEYIENNKGEKYYKIEGNLGGATYLVFVSKEGNVLKTEKKETPVELPEEDDEGESNEF